jgi:hypothetical protein
VIWWSVVLLSAVVNAVTQCVGGFAQSGSGSNIFCTPCSAGTAATAGSTNCDACPAKTYSGAQSATCTNCTVFSTSAIGSSTCVCNTDKYSLGVASTLMCLYFPSSQPTARPSMQPTVQPTRQPSGQPTRRPTSQPSSQPTARPSSQPSASPTSGPSSQPSARPSRQPTGLPTRRPTSQPTAQPSNLPVTRPTAPPTSSPSGRPSRQPSSHPTAQPFGHPTSMPTQAPTLYKPPTGQPTVQPSSRPSVQPSSRPSTSPSTDPTSRPTRAPITQPPSSWPTRCPSTQPSSRPSAVPTLRPSSQPTSQPTRQPTRQPTSQPSRQPTTQPSSQPTVQPTSSPTGAPSSYPTSSVHVLTSSSLGAPTLSALSFGGLLFLCVCTCGSYYAYYRCACCRSNKNKRNKVYLGEADIELKVGGELNDEASFIKIEEGELIDGLELDHNASANAGRAHGRSTIRPSSSSSTRPSTPMLPRKLTNGEPEDIVANTLATLKAIQFGIGPANGSSTASPTVHQQMLGTATIAGQPKKMLNHAVIVVKPGFNSHGILYFIQSALVECIPSSKVVFRKNYSTDLLKQHNLVDKYYGLISKWALDEHLGKEQTMNRHGSSVASDPSNGLTSAEEELFNAHFSDSWQLALSESRVYSAMNYKFTYQYSNKQLYKQCEERSRRCLRIRKGIQVHMFEETYTCEETIQELVPPPEPSLQDLELQAQLLQQQQLQQHSQLMSNSNRGTKFGKRALERTDLPPIESLQPNKDTTCTQPQAPVYITKTIRVEKTRQIYCVNGFYPLMREKFLHPHDNSNNRSTPQQQGPGINVFVVEWDGNQLSYTDFMQRVIGDRDPAKADPLSVRGLLYASWGSLQLDSGVDREKPEAPSNWQLESDRKKNIKPTLSQLDLLNNAISVSGSVFEAFRDRLLWCPSMSIENDVFGGIFLAAFVAHHGGNLISSTNNNAFSKQHMILLIQQWCCNNPIVNGKRVLDWFDRCDTNQCLAKAKILINIWNSQQQPQQLAPIALFANKPGRLSNS